MPGCRSGQCLYGFRKRFLAFFAGEHCYGLAVKLREGGKLDGTPLALLSEGGGAKALFPHVAALEMGVFASCFTEQGYLFHTRGD